MKSLIRALLGRRFIITLAALATVAIGYYQYLKLPVEAFPDLSPNLVQVFTVTEGLAPEEVEKYVTYPIEVAMNGLPKLRLIRSVSNFGLSVVSIYFEDDTDIYLARQLVNERLRLAQEQIPEGFGRPQLGPISTSMGLVLVTVMNQRRHSGLGGRDVAVEGAVMRIRPVLMTALTTALGLIPLLLATGTGSEVQRPLATVVLGGLLTATLLTLLVVPTLYGWFVPERPPQKTVHPWVVISPTAGPSPNHLPWRADRRHSTNPLRSRSGSGCYLGDR